MKIFLPKIVALNGELESEWIIKKKRYSGSIKKILV
jgi:hypothetical protein